MIKSSLIMAAAIAAFATASHAKTPFKPTGETIVDLLTSGWDIVGEAGNGIFLLQKDDQVSLCALNFTGGHGRYLEGDKERADRFSTIDANCAALNE